MACFLVPAAEAAVVKAAEKAAEKRAEAAGEVRESAQRMGMVRKLKWLSNMLWGGALLLLFEHVWHGEVAPWFPFLTAMSSPDSALEMLTEMATTGVLMAALITSVWAGMVLVTNAMEKKALSAQAALR